MANAQISKLIQNAASIIISLGLTVSGWFLTEAFSKLEEIESRIYTVEINQATTNGNRFSSVDWQTNKAILDADRLALDKRVTVLEETTKNIHQLLTEIKADLKALRQEHYNDMAK